MIKVFFISSQANNNFGVNQVIYSLKKFLSKKCIFKQKQSLIKFSKSNYDLIHIHGCWKINILFFFIISKLKNLKITISPHGMLDPYSLNQKKYLKFIAWHFFQKYIFKFSNQIIVNSYLEKKNVSRMINHHNIKVVPHGITVSNKIEKRKKNKNLEFVFFSRIHHSKNLLKLVNLWTKKIFFKKYNLSIYGEISDLKYFNLIKSKIKNIKNIKYKGAIYQKKEKILSYYDVFIFPSHSENFGLVILEAMSSGLYLILNKNLPWKHLKKEGFASFSNFKEQNLKREILKIEQKREKIRGYNYTKKTHLYLIKNYSWEKISNKYISTYKNII